MIRSLEHHINGIRAERKVQKQTVCFVELICTKSFRIFSNKSINSEIVDFLNKTSNQPQKCRAFDAKHVALVVP